MAGKQERGEQARFAMGRGLSRRKQRLNRLLISATASVASRDVV
jgi:hypothetical protein